MKELMILLLAFVLLLSGCAAPSIPSPSSAVTVEESSTPIPSNPPASSTPLDLESFSPEDLPTSPLPMNDLWWRESCPELYMLAELPEADIALYGVNQYDGPYSEDPLFLRYGSSLQWLEQTSYSVRYTPTLTWADFDNDGSNELVAIYCIAYGTGCFIQELHLYEWDGSAWNDQLYSPKDYEAQVRQGVSYGYSASDETFSLSLGNTTIESPVCTAPTGLGFGEWAYFDVDGSELQLRLYLCAYFEKSLPQIIGNYTATVTYDGERFSLRHLSLTAPE